MERFFLGDTYSSMVFHSFWQGVFVWGALLTEATLPERTKRAVLPSVPICYFETLSSPLVFPEKTYLFGASRNTHVVTISSK